MEDKEQRRQQEKCEGRSIRDRDVEDRETSED